MVKKGSERADGNSSGWTNEWMDGWNDSCLDRNKSVFL